MSNKNQLKSPALQDDERFALMKVKKSQPTVNILIHGIDISACIKNENFMKLISIF
jgi:hypothetical protein